MKILAIECSAKTVSAALAIDGRLICEGYLNIQLTHSETLMPIIYQVLENSGTTLHEIDAFAVTAGPGSFTGIRIGVSAVKGLAFAENKPIYSYSSLEASALGNLSSDCTLCALMDARASRYFAAFIEIKDKKISRISKDEILSQNDLENIMQIQYNKKKVMLAGDGAKLFYSKASDTANLYLAHETSLIQRAAGFAIHCSSEDCDREPLSAASLQPIYLIKSQAERERQS